MKSLPSRGLQIAVDENEWNGAWVIGITGVLLLLVTFYVLESVAGIPVFRLIFDPSSVDDPKYKSKRGAAVVILCATLALIVVAMVVYVRRRNTERDEGDGTVTSLRRKR